MQKLHSKLASDGDLKTPLLTRDVILCIFRVSYLSAD